MLYVLNGSIVNSSWKIKEPIMLLCLPQYMQVRRESLNHVNKLSMKTCHLCLEAITRLNHERCKSFRERLRDERERQSVQERWFVVAPPWTTTPAFLIGGGEEKLGVTRFRWGWLAGRVTATRGSTWTWFQRLGWAAGGQAAWRKVRLWPQTI